MKASRIICEASIILFGVALLSGCCTTRDRRTDPIFPPASGPEQRYKVHVGDKQFLVDSVRFQGEWVILEGGYPATKAIWMRRDRVDSMDVPK